MMRRPFAPVPLLVATTLLAVIPPARITLVAGRLRQNRLAVIASGTWSIVLAARHLTSVRPGVTGTLVAGWTAPVEEARTMVESGKISDKAAELAGQAAAAAGPLAAQAKEKASELAGQAAAAAGPLAAQAKEKATVLAGQAAAAAGPLAAQAKDRAAELAEKASETATHSVSALAESLDKATGGKYSDRISSVTAKLEERLDRDKPTT